MLESDPERLWSVRDVVEKLGMVWVDAHSRTAQQYRRALGRLNVLEKAEEKPIKNGLGWRLKPLARTPDKPDNPDNPVAAEGVWGGHRSDNP